MSKLRPVEADKVVKALNKLGFEIARQKGSYLVMKTQTAGSPWYLSTGEKSWAEAYSGRLPTISRSERTSL